MDLQQVRANTARKRSALFRTFIAGMPRPVRVIDIGGTQEMWRRWQFSEADGVCVTLVNDHVSDVRLRDEATLGASFTKWWRDARQLRPGDYADFDVVFSNSTLEHLYTRDNQRLVAGSIVASGKPFFVQVPNPHSPVDPHFPHPFAAFFGTWPRHWQAAALTRHALGSGRKYDTIDAALHRLENYLPVDRPALHELFPDARIVTEWTFGLPLSLIAQRAGPNS